MKRLLLLLVPALIYGQNLKSLIEYAKKNNDLVISRSLNQKSHAKDVDSKKSAYLPVIDIGGYYESSNGKTFRQPGDIYSGYAKVSFDIYDGGRKSSLLKKSKSEFRASKHDTNEMKRSLSLEISKDFYAIKSLKASLVAKEDAGKSLQEQLIRIKKYYEARLATTDDVDRLQAAYDTNIYDLEALKFQILTKHKSLELKVGMRIENLEESAFKEIVQKDIKYSDEIISLKAKEKALMSSARSIESAYYPDIKIQDKYSLYGYGRTDVLHPEGLKNQNQIILSANIRLFDFWTLKEAKQAVVINSQALGSEVMYKIKEQKIENELALSRIATSKIKIKSAKSALVAARSAYETINEKYSAGIVDYVIYLDALTSKTSANALYETSLNELEVAYAMYYYYSGKNLEEFIK